MKPLPPYMYGKMDTWEDISLLCSLPHLHVVPMALCSILYLSVFPAAFLKAGSFQDWHCVGFLFFFPTLWTRGGGYVQSWLRAMVGWF